MRAREYASNKSVVEALQHERVHLRHLVRKVDELHRPGRRVDTQTTSGSGSARRGCGTGSPSAAARGLEAGASLGPMTAARAHVDILRASSGLNRREGKRARHVPIPLLPAPLAMQRTGCDGPQERVPWSKGQGAARSRRGRTMRTEGREGAWEKGSRRGKMGGRKGEKEGPCFVRKTWNGLGRLQKMFTACLL